jgi:exodeoxyribonuclease-3
MSLSAERQSRAGSEVRLQAALVRTAGELRQTLLDSGAPVVLVGDFNVMPTDLDVYAPERWVDDALFRPEVREAYRQLIEQGWTDALRALHPNERIYTFWKYFRNAFAPDARLRIHRVLGLPERTKMVDLRSATLV